MKNNREKEGRQSHNKRRRVTPALLERIQPDAAGIDCGSEHHYVAVPRDRVGKAKAITATARKLALLVYRVLRGDIVYSDPGDLAYEQRHRARTVISLRKRAKQFGFGLVNLQTGEILEGAVS